MVKWAPRARASCASATARPRENRGYAHRFAGHRPVIIERTMIYPKPGVLSLWRGPPRNVQKLGSKKQIFETVAKNAPGRPSKNWLACNNSTSGTAKVPYCRRKATPILRQFCISDNPERKSAVLSSKIVARFATVPHFKPPRNGKVPYCRRKSTSDLRQLRILAIPER